MKNTLLTVVSGSAAAPIAVPYVLMKRLHIDLSCAIIFYLKEKVAEQNLPIVRKWIEIISSKCTSSAFEIVSVGISDDDMETMFPQALRQILSSEKEARNNVYVDVTCGRKYFSDMMVKIGMEFVPPVVDILYCYLKDRRYRGEPCPRIPVTHYQVLSILREKPVLKR